MNNRNTENQLFELFGQTADIPESTQNRMNGLYAQIRREAGSRQMTGVQNAKRGYVNPFAKSRFTKKTAVIFAAAALAVLFACGAAAQALTHPDFFDSIWGGQPGTEINYYESAMGEVGQYPAFERVELDLEQAEQTVGDYVVGIGKSYTCGECTVTLLEYMCDDNGMGYLSYTIECGTGLDFINEVGNGLVWLEKHDGCLPVVYTADGEMTNQYIIRNDSMSTETKAHLSTAFTAWQPMSDEDGLRLELGTGEFIELPAFAKLPSVVFADANGTMAARVSALGVSIGGDVQEIDMLASEVTIESSQGDYLVRSIEQNIENNVCSSLVYETSSVNIIFNRLVMPQEAVSVICNGVRLLPADEASVSDIFAPSNTAGSGEMGTDITAPSQPSGAAD